MSAFSGLFIGTSAIHASQRGLNVTGQNIANSATPGYSRQRVDLESIGGPGVPAFWSTYDGSGEGVKVTGVSRMTDAFLVARANAANSSLGSIEEKATTLAGIERIVGEPGDTGLQKQLQEFWQSWGKVASDPVGDAPRNLVFENAGKVTTQLNRMASAAQTQWDDSIAKTDALIEDVNVMAQDVARLNSAIRHNNIAKVPTNELLDQRDVLISRIAELTGATVAPAEVDQGAQFKSDAVDVFIDGIKLVDGIKANALSMTMAEGGDPPAGLATTPDQMTITLTDAEGSKTDLTAASGRIGGMIDSVNTTIPKYAQRFDDVAADLSRLVNAQQTQGFTWSKQPDGSVTGATGSALFTGGSALTLSLVEGATPGSLATSKGDPGANQLDGHNALAMTDLMKANDGPDAKYRALVVALGVETQSANRNTEVQRNVVMRAEDARDNVSGVSLNEEMTNMIQFQHSFSAAARYISTIDQVLETLINMKR